MQRAVIQTPGQHAAAFALFHNQIEHNVFNKEFGIMFQRLLIQGMQNRMAGLISRRAGALRLAFAVMRGHAAKGALINFAFGGSGERHAVMFQFDDGRNGFTAHVFDGILVAQPVRTFDGVVHVKAPVIFAHIAQRGTDAALRGDGMTAGGKYFADAGRFQTFFHHAKGGTQTCAASTHDDDIVLMFNNFIICRHELPN